jgi:hypothetical protein
MEIAAIVLALFLGSVARSDETSVKDYASASRTSSRFKGVLGGDWFGKIDTERKTDLDAAGRTNGSDVQSDWELARIMFGTWGPLATVTLRTYDKENLDAGKPAPKGVKKKSADWKTDSDSYADDAGAGIRAFYRAFGTRWENDVTLHRVWDSTRRTQYGYSNFLQWEAKGNFAMGHRAKTKVRYRYLEYFRDRGDAGTDQRQSKLEITPSAYYEGFSAGLQNILTNRIRVGTGLSTVSIAPYLKYERHIFELALKMIYLPFVTGDGQLFAEGWGGRPVYSVDLQVNL